MRTIGSWDPEYQIPSNWHREDNDGSSVSSHQPIEKQGQRYLFSQPCPWFGPPFTVTMVLRFCDSFSVCLWVCLGVPKGQGLALILLNTVFSVTNIVAEGTKGMDTRCLLPRDLIHSCDHASRTGGQTGYHLVDINSTMANHTISLLVSKLK